ncbi:MAG TPA: hypothetical protein VGR38_03730 [Candidatus Polarisedimenticolia bacterium]|nr:hypothetical protein [Candidatus Polarisedimenticolia bacterium]
MSERIRGKSWELAILLVLALGVMGLVLGCGQHSDQQAANNEEASNEPAAQPSDQQDQNPPAEPSREPAPSEPVHRPAPAAPAPRPAAPRAPETVAVMVPEATTLRVKLEQSLNSGTNQAGDMFKATLLAPVIVGDRVVLQEGSTIDGTVTDVVPAKKGIKESGGSMTLSFDRITNLSGNSASMAASFAKQAKSTGKKAGTIGGAAAGGALLGKVLGGDTKDAAIGAVVGGAIGTGVAAGTKGSELKLEAGTELTITLEKPITFQMKR